MTTTHTPLVIKDPQMARTHVEEWQQQGLSVGFVPTMGSLHKGHMALIDAAKKRADKVVASIFVNPKQFGQGEDYEKYPRDTEKDMDLLADHGCDMVYLPDTESMYPKGFASIVTVKGLTDMLCGAYRPGHFNGVATVVTILLNTIPADFHFFGKKDYQQLLVIKRLSKDLNLKGEVIGVPIVRDEEGLALSSRNQYLSEEEHHIATRLYAMMQWIKMQLGPIPTDAVLNQAKERLLESGFSKIDYLDIRDKDTLERILDKDFSNARIFVAAYLGSTRLIDNIALYDEREPS